MTARTRGKITGHRSTSMSPAWSPNGESIAYTSFFNGAPGLYLADLGERPQAPDHHLRLAQHQPVLLAGRRQVAFARSFDGNVEIFTADMDGGNLRRLTNSNAIDTNPAWSPKGGEIAFTSSRAGNPHIYLMDSEGANQRRITYEGTYNDGAAWSPDGDLIAYTSRRDGRFQIAVTNVVTLESRVLTSGPGENESPTFSPDGRKIAFTSSRGGSNRSTSWISTAAMSASSRPRGAMISPIGREACQRGKGLIELKYEVPGSIGPKQYRPVFERGEIMNRKWMIWMVMATLLTFLYGCPKKKPATPPSDLNVETTTVPAPPSTPPPAQDVQQPATPDVADQTEDLLKSADLQVVNDELKRRGFSPDIYFDYDEATLSDDTRDKLSRNADLLKSQAQFSMTLEGHADSRAPASTTWPSASAAPTPSSDTWARWAWAPTACAPSATARSGRLHRVRGELLVAEPPRPHGDHRARECRLSA